MADEMFDVQDDDPNLPSEPVIAKNTGKSKPAVKPEPDDVDNDANVDAELAKALREAEEEDEEDTPKVEPKAEPQPEPAKEPVKTPAEVEAEAERKAEERYQVKLAEIEKRHEAERQRAIDAVVKKERSREDSALRKLRDIQAVTGLDTDKLLEAHRTREIERLQTEEALTESAARALLEAREKAALYEARETDRQREHEDAIKTSHYREQKLAFLEDAKQDPIYKTALQKYTADVDEFSDQGRSVAFDVALRYIAGQHLPEIVAELNKGSAEREAKLKAEIDAAKKAGEQSAIRNMQNRQKAAPETSTTGVPQKEFLPKATARMALRMGLDPKEIAKTTAAKQKNR